MCRGLGAFKIRLHPSPTAVTEGGTASGSVMDVNTVLPSVSKTTLTHDGLVHGICEAAKASDKHRAHLQFMCLHPTVMSVKLVEALSSKPT